MTALGAISPDGGEPDLVAISIVGYRNVDDIVPCLQALEQSTFTNFAVLICENGGPQSFELLMAALERHFEANPITSTPKPGRWSEIGAVRLKGGQLVEILCAADNLGYAGGVNATLERLAAFPRWQAVWVLNPDTMAAPGALSALTAKAASDPRYGVIGSRIILAASNTIHAYGGRWQTFKGRGRSIGMLQPLDAVPDIAAVERDMTYVLGTSMYVTRGFIESVGMMDEEYFLYVEEVDWCFRRGTFRLGYADDSIVYHHHGTTLGSNLTRRRKPRLAVYLGERNKHLFARKFQRGLYPVIALSTLALTAQYPLAGAWRNFGVALSGWWAGLRGEAGKPTWLP